MAYTILDVIKKLTELEKKGQEIYKGILENPNTDFKVRFFANLMLKQEIKHEEILNDLYLRIDFYKNQLESIDISLYDKVSQVITIFNKNLKLPEYKNPIELLKYALEFENATRAVLIDIQGKLFSKENEFSFTYQVIDKLIKEEESHETDILKMLAL